MDFVRQYGKEIVALVVPFIAWVLNVGIKAKPKLIWSYPHTWDFLVQEPLLGPNGDVLNNTQIVRTASILILNQGRETANKVEVVFNWEPMYLNLFPPRHYDVHKDRDSRYILIFDDLSPKEEIRIEILAVNRALPETIQIRAANCFARRVEMTWMQGVPRWRVKAAIGLMLLGAATLVYFLIAFLQILIIKTPLSI